VKPALSLSVEVDGLPRDTGLEMDRLDSPKTSTFLWTYYGDLWYRYWTMNTSFLRTMMAVSALFFVSPWSISSAGPAPIQSQSAVQPQQASCEGELLVTTEATEGHFDGVRSIVIRDGIGNVDISPSPNGSTTVNTRACWRIAKPTLTQEVLDGTLTITSECPSSLSVLNPCKRDIRILAPAGVDLDALAQVGDVSATGMAGPTKLETAAGSARANAMLSDRIRASSHAGTASVDAVKAPFEVVATTDVGSVDVTVPAGAYAIDAASTIGLVSITGVTQEPSSPHRITARSETGSVQIKAR
jgi:hypothetical protein